MAEGYWGKYWRRRVSRRRVLAGGATLAAGSAAILAGCGDDDDDDDDGGEDPTATSAAGETPAATATEPAAGGPTRGGTFRTWKTTEDQGLDPAVFHTNNGEQLGLFNHLLDFQVSKGEFSMDAALSFEQVDDTTLVWNIRQGMEFHNGDPVTTEDVAYTLGRPPAVYAELGTTHQPRSNFLYIDSVEAIDGENVQENWTTPNVDRLIHRSRWYFGIVNKVITEGNGGMIQEHPFGASAGPYTLDTRNAQGTRIVRNPNYYAHPNPDDGFVEDGPYIDEMQASILPDPAAAKAAFLSGDLDYFGSPDVAELDDFTGYDGAAVEEASAGGWAVLGFDGGKFYDERARRAVRAGINYDAYIASIWAGEGKLQAPLTVANTAFQRLSQEDLAEYMVYDPAEARKLWEASEHPDLDSILISTVANPAQQLISEFCQQNLQEALGISVEVEALDVQTWVNGATVQGRTKPWDLLQSGSGGAGGTDGTPDTNYLSWYDPQQYAKNSFNHHFESPHQSILDGAAVVEDFIKRQAVEFDHEARVEIITELQRWILDHAWSVHPLPIATNSFLVVSKRLRDYGKDDWFNAYSTGGFPRRESAWLAEA